MQRRKFLAAGVALPAALAATPQATQLTGKPASHTGPFKLSLKADAIGVNLGADELLDSVIEIGYEALSVPAQWLEGWSAERKESFAAKAREHKISWGANGLPVEFRESEERFRKELADLPVHAKNLRDIGVDRIGTWILSSNAALTYNENMRLHADRLGEAAKILGDNGIALGLEYLGTTALRHSGRFAFLSSGKELKELIGLIGQNNVGVILDSYHWYTAREGKEDLLRWSNEEIVAVDLNDANNQLSLDEQTDIARELPGATGVIDLASFVRALVEIGYDGPIRAEPFSRTLDLMDDRLAMQATYAAMTNAIDGALAGE